MSKHPVKRLRDDDGEIIPDEYEYRGHEFRLDTSVTRGYYGRYKMGGWRNGRGFTLRADVLRHIDRLEEGEQT